MPLNINGTTGISGVDGSVSAPAVTGTDSNTGITFPSADVIKFSTAGVERMAITNSGVTGITAGITMADQWRLSTNFTQGNNVREVIDQNWERADTDSYGAIGSPMTESSGIFTFPETGKYLLLWNHSAYSSSAHRYVGVLALLSTDTGGSYSTIGETYDSIFDAGNSAFGAGAMTIIVDVTNASTFKLKWNTSTSGTVEYDANSTQQRTGFSCIKLGDT